MFGPTPATPDDCLPIAQLHHAAFTGANLPLYNHIWGKCAAADLHAFRAEKYRSAVRDCRGQTRIMVMRDGRTGEVVSFAIWISPKSDGGDQGVAVAEVPAQEEEVGDVKREGTLWVLPEGYDAAVMKRSVEQSAERERHLPAPPDKMWSK